MRGTKLLSLASAVILGLSAIPMSVSAADGVDANGRDLKYDINLDGEVNLLDFDVIMEYYAIQQIGADYRTDKRAIAFGITDEVYANIQANGDYDNDGFVSAKEGTIMRTYLVNTGFLSGDINRDGRVDSVDASDILSCYAKVQTTENYYLGEEYISLLAYGDENFDGSIDAEDASNVLSAYAKTQTE